MLKSHNTLWRAAGPAILSLVMVALLAYPGLGVQANPPSPTGQNDVDAVTASPSLHNPTFDNHKWYEFSGRYDSSYPAGSWLPDDDTAGGPQDWRLWFQDGTDILETDPEATYAHHTEGVQIRTYGQGKHLGGLYQPIYGVTPCLTYQFTMYVWSFQEESTDSLVALQVGIDRAGWHPDSANDPAIDAFPSTTVWGTSRRYTSGYGQLSVTAEAFDDQITVFTYADANGGRSHRILWDTGSFANVTPAWLYDPEDLSATGGINGLTATPGTTSATVSWTTSSSGISQVYYQSLGPSTSPTATQQMTYTVYLPLVNQGSHWQATTLNTTPKTSHAFTLTGLEPGYVYEYIVVTRGVSGAQCASWVSSRQEFTTNE
ncbi:MAG: fibronectin type III domain-containing protein [Anaerolineae bacterium]|nr:fibronectin type III domain-containing protein [Anaerolineae bacterium]